MHPRITQVQVPGPFRVTLTFTDGSAGTVDLAPWIEGKTGVFAALRDATFFAKVTVDPEAGTIVWPNGADLDPDILFEAAHGVTSGVDRLRGGV
jgi:hypothetical protein